MSNGLVYKRCGCRDPETRKSLDSACPKLHRPNGAWSADHGSWYMQIELAKTAQGRRRQLRIGGFSNYRETSAALDHARELLQLAGGDKDRRNEVSELMLAAKGAGLPLPDIDSIRQRLHADMPLAEKPTLAEYLSEWLVGLGVDENTINGYESHVRVHLIPHLGKLRIDKIRPRHIKAMFAQIEARNAEIVAAKNSVDPEMGKTVRGVRPTGPNTCQRIRATLRKALNDALAEEIILGTNPATLVKTPGDRALPMIWEEERVQRWKATGEIPGPVMVWTDDQLAEFLEYAAEHDPDLYALYHFTAYRGSRRGESAGLRDSEVRLKKRVATINNQIATIGYKTKQKPPKSKSGNRELTFDEGTMAVLSAYRARRAAQRLAAGQGWPDTGLFFVRPDGHPWHPNSITARFRRLVRKSGLPPIRFHDLRHCAATIALAAGVDVKVVQEQLGHSTSTLTRDTYQSVSKQLHAEAAEAVATIIDRQRRKRSA